MQKAKAVFKQHSSTGERAEVVIIILRRQNHMEFSIIIKSLLWDVHVIIDAIEPRYNDVPEFTC